MKLTLIYGREGCGKSTLIYGLCKQKKEKNRKTVVIVPDQYTHQTELDLISAFGSEGLTDTEVLSFKRLSHRLKLLYGGASVVVINDEGKSMLINRIINRISNEDKENTTLLANAATAELCPDIAHIIARFKQYGITPEELELCSLNKEKYPRTASKVSEIARVYKEYEEIKNGADGGKYRDSEDDSELLCKNIAESGFFADADVFIDGFDDFTMTDQKVLEQLIKSSESVTVALPLDVAEDRNRQFLFRRQRQMINNTVRIAENCGIVPDIIRFSSDEKEIDNKTVFASARRNKPALDFIEKNVFSIIPENPVAPDGIKLVTESSVRAEAEHTADKITSLAKENGVRYNEIAIVVSDVEKYGTFLKRAFEKRNIPYFMDFKRDISDNAIVRFILTLIDTVVERKSTKSIISFLKSGLLTSANVLFTYNEIAYLEKYCKRYYINGKAWSNDFTFGKNHYDLEKLNRTRKKVLDLLTPFEESINGKKTARKLSEALINYLEDFNVNKITDDRIDQLNADGENDIALEFNNIRNVVNDTLRQVKTFLSDAVITVGEFRDVLQNCFAGTEINVIPACIDQVLVLPAGRTMAKHIRALFIVGANGISVGEESGIFSMTELELLREHNIDIGADREKMLSDEEYYIYKILSKPTDLIHVSFVKGEASDNSAENPILINALKKLFGNSLKEGEPEPFPSRIADCRNIGELQDAVLFEKTTLTRKDESFDAVSDWLRKNAGERFCYLSDIAEKGSAFSFATEKLPSDMMMKKNDGEYVIAVTGITEYMKCPYKYFAEKCLRIRGDYEGRVSYIDAGLLVHTVLQKFTVDIASKKKVNEAYAEQFLNENFDAEVEKYENGKFTDTDTNLYYLGRIKTFLLKAMRTFIMQKNVSSTDFVAAELKFEGKTKTKDKLPALRLSLDDATDFSMIGTIDCVESFTSGENKYYLVTDYKTGGALGKDAILKNKELQLPVYMEALKQSDPDAKPGAMFYVHINDKLKKPDDVKNRFGKAGIVADDNELHRGIDENSIENGVSKLAKSSVFESSKNCGIVSAEEIESVCNGAIEKVKAVFSDMIGGSISKEPLDNECTRKNLGAGCPFRRFCGYDKTLCKTENVSPDCITTEEGEEE